MFQFSACPLPALFDSSGSTWTLLQVGCPIRKPPGQSWLAAHRGLSQLCYVLRRLLVPRHPPCALSSLTFLSSLFSDRGSASMAPLRASMRHRHVHLAIVVRILFSRRLAILVSRCGLHSFDVELWMT